MDRIPGLVVVVEKLMIEDTCCIIFTFIYIFPASFLYFLGGSTIDQIAL